LGNFDLARLGVCHLRLFHHSLDRQQCVSISRKPESKSVYITSESKLAQKSQNPRSEFASLVRSDYYFMEYTCLGSK
jgi:hypothetical protein